MNCEGAEFGCAPVKDACKVKLCEHSNFRNTPMQIFDERGKNFNIRKRDKTIAHKQTTKKKVCVGSCCDVVSTGSAGWLHCES